MSFNISFIGAVGLPNRYGGFEMFLEACAPLLAKEFDEVLVTCDKTKYTERELVWAGVKRVFIPIPANGALSVLHDLLAFFAVFWRAHAIVVLGVSGGIFFPLFRLLCSLFDKQLIVNVDGVEWRRAKFSKTRRQFLYISDRLAQRFAHEVVVDNEGLRPFLIRAVRDKASLIAYSGDHVLRDPSATMAPDGSLSCLTICRIEPENNCDLLLEAFARAERGTYVFVGNWNASEYGRQLRHRYRDVLGLEIRDPIYDKAELAKLREQCNVYLHGHSVGGTNPSLVEMLFYDCHIVAFDCAFNRCTAGDAIRYFAGDEALAAQLQDFDWKASFDRRMVRNRYTATRIAGAYASLIRGSFVPVMDGLVEDESRAELLEDVQTGLD